MNKVLILLVTIALWLESSSVLSNQSADELTIADAIKLIRIGDDYSARRGVEMLKSLAVSGNADAYFHLGELARRGIGFKEASLLASSMYYRSAAQLGHSRAALNLANILYFDSEQTDHEVAEAITLWQREALKGEPEAMYLIGMMYWNGEASFTRDLLKGYGLVWRSSKEGYEPAIQNELTMSAHLSKDAKFTARKYALEIEELGFQTEPLALHLVPETGVIAPSPAQETTKKVEEQKKLIKPENWDDVWHMQIGFAMSELEARRLQTIISTSQPQIVGNLYWDIIESSDRPGLQQLVLGPATSLQDAVMRCVALQQEGYECYTQAPNN